MRTLPTRAAIAIIALVLVLPLTGALVAGHSLAEFMQFPPPLQIPTNYVRFSPLAAVAVATVLAGVTLPWVFGRHRPASVLDDVTSAATKKRRTFPAWGWAAVAWTGGWWTLAWTRWDWFQPLQLHTFFPLWVGFIISVNAATQQRVGSCLLRRNLRRWLFLFCASAACWWAFEWLNRFVHNWHYLNVEAFSACGYFLNATLCFATVLPAVAAVAEWLSSHRRWNKYVGQGPAWTWLARRETSVALAAFGCFSLLATGLWPRWFYPALWVSPLALFIAASVLLGRPGLAQEIARGDWRRAVTWMLASLVCGFFWELWNWHSQAKWIYTVPGVERWYLFEMPLLGYAGYLPFGLECWFIAEWAVGDRWQALDRKPRPRISANDR